MNREEMYYRISASFYCDEERKDPYYLFEYLDKEEIDQFIDGIIDDLTKGVEVC